MSSRQSASCVDCLRFRRSPVEIVRQLTAICRAIPHDHDVAVVGLWWGCRGPPERPATHRPPSDLVRPRPRTTPGRPPDDPGQPPGHPAWSPGRLRRRNGPSGPRRV